MRTRRSIKLYFAFAMSAIMIWVIVMTPHSSEVKAQIIDGDFTATPSMTEVGSYVFLQLSSLQPNTTYYLAYDHNREHVNGICPDETMTSDADGRWTKLIGPLTSADVGDWLAGVQQTSYCGEGYIHSVSWQVTPLPYRVTASKDLIEPNSGPTSFFISGAPPNSPIDWTTYKDGQKIQNARNYGEYTDANGQLTKVDNPCSPLAW